MTDARVDYRMRRQAVVREVAAGVRSAASVCDAPPELARAARHLGAPREEPCPICARDELVLLSYVFDRHDPRPGGRAMRIDDVAAHADRRGVVTSYEVEVCRACGWHHLIAMERVHARLAGGATAGGG